LEQGQGFKNYAQKEEQQRWESSTETTTAIKEVDKLRSNTSLKVRSCGWS
jgi:hypothetical protein